MCKLFTVYLFYLFNHISRLCVIYLNFYFILFDYKTGLFVRFMYTVLFILFYWENKYY